MAPKSKRKSISCYLNLKYPVTITPSEDGGYIAEIEDRPGCFTQGESLEEICTNMEEARRLWIELACENGRDIPEPHGKQVTV